MKLRLTNDYSLQVAGAEGIKVYEGKAGETLDLPDDIAVTFLNAGVAEALKTEKASKSKGETAEK